MKANTFRFELFYESAGFGVEGFAGGRGNWGIGIQSKLKVIGLEQRSPCKFALGI
jgi:hypothetical protein